MTLVLHHIGIVVKDIARSAGAYAARFHYRVSSEVIHDPLQTAYVQFLECPGANVRIELVSPDGEGGKLGNALKKGGGLNHLAYLTPAIEEHCSELRSSGMMLLQSPVAAAAFPGRRIAWLMGQDGIPVELVEDAPPSSSTVPTKPAGG